MDDESIQGPVSPNLNSESHQFHTQKAGAQKLVRNPPL